MQRNNNIPTPPPPSDVPSSPSGVPSSDEDLNEMSDGEIFDQLEDMAEESVTLIFNPEIATAAAAPMGNTISYLQAQEQIEGNLTAVAHQHQALATAQQALYDAVVNDFSSSDDSSLDGEFYSLPSSSNIDDDNNDVPDSDLDPLYQRRSPR